MRYTGRMLLGASFFVLHSLYILYYYIRDAHIERLDLYSTPFLILFGIWVGKQFDVVKYVSDRDVLTGLYNRRFVMGSFEKISSLAERTKSKLFVLVIDCDNFKFINDEYGHQVGDEVLTNIGESLVGLMRKSDIVARWGGDEFLVIGYHKEGNGLGIILDRLEECFENLTQKMNVPVKVSIGSAIFPDDHKDLFQLIKIADKNMYMSKSARKKHA